MMEEKLLTSATLSDGSVTQILKLWPTMPLPVLTALAVLTMLERTVTPFKLCECGSVARPSTAKPVSPPPREHGSEISEPECSHDCCFLSLNGPTAKEVCSDCDQDILWFIPTPPEVAGYTSAIWKSWEKKFPRRYPMQVRSQFPKKTNDAD